METTVGFRDTYLGSYRCYIVIMEKKWKLLYSV